VQDPRRTTPLRIDADRAAGTLGIAWADGHATAYDTTTLRWLCPCAYCRGEAGMPGWLDSNPSLTPAQTRLVDVGLVGTYAIQITWGDGHATGYHTFMLLRERCPCVDCTRERAQRHADHAAAGGVPADGPGAADRHWHGGSG
jgi:prepilin-type processing-associated H-X9-DG protein